MKMRGQHLTLEAMLSLLILFAIVSIPAQMPNENLDELHILQKQDDLLKIWLYERNLDYGQLEKDFEFVFPKASGLIEINGEGIPVGTTTNYRNAHSTSGFVLNKNLQMIEIRITIYV